MKTKRYTKCLAAVLVSLAACSDNPGGPEQPGASSVSFAYQGPPSGTFMAEGDPQTNKGMLEQTFAYGLRYQSPSAIEIRSVRQRTGNVVDWVDVNIPGQSAGSFTINSDACPWSDDQCPGASVVLELPNANGAQAKYSCQLENGTIRLKALSDTRATGDFSGTGRCIQNTGQVIEGFTVTNVRFDVNLFNGTRG